MSLKPKDPLLSLGKGLTYFMQGVMAIAFAALLVAVPVLIIWQDDIAAELASELGQQAAAFPLWPAVSVLLLAAIAIAMVFVFFGRLRQIIATVGEGDPFVPENAERLTTMAWLLLGVQLLSIPIGGIGLMVARWADEVGHEDITIDAGLDITGLLMVVVLFILARVFRHGAAMREDLEGTV